MSQWFFKLIVCFVHYLCLAVYLFKLAEEIQMQASKLTIQLTATKELIVLGSSFFFISEH